MQLILREFILLAQNYLANRPEQKRAIGALQDVRMQPCSQSEREAHFWAAGRPSWCRAMSLKQDPRVLQPWHFASASHSGWLEATAWYGGTPDYNLAGLGICLAHETFQTLPVTIQFHRTFWLVNHGYNVPKNLFYFKACLQ